MSAVAVQGRLVEVAAGEGGGPALRQPVGEEKTFRPYDPDQVLLLAPVLSEWVLEGDLAHFVSDLVESGALDLSAIYAAYEEERGYPPYDPRLMVKLLVYGYANGVVSSRKLERASYRDVAVRMLCADQHPDYRSIARFRARHLEALGELFVQALRLCRQARLVGLGTLPSLPSSGQTVVPVLLVSARARLESQRCWSRRGWRRWGGRPAGTRREP